MQQAYNPQTGEVLFLVNNQWVKPQQEAVNPETKERAFLVEGAWQVVPSSVFGAARPEPTPEEQSVFRQVADVPLKVGAGIVQGVRMIADAFGAGSATSKAIKGAEDWIAALYSAQSRNDSQEVARIMKEAEDKGAADQVKAGLRAFSVAPIDFVAQGLGTAAPTILAALGSQILGAGALATTAITAGLGTVMGAGVVKGAIYDAVKEELAKTNMPKDEIEKRAELAQRYNGENLDQILMGAAIGGLAARTGLEGSVARAAAARITGKAAAAEAAETAARQQVATKTAEAAARGPILQGVRTGVVESGTEFVQGAQEQAAKNIALQREGYDVPTMRGVVGGGTLEALAGAPIGAAFGAREAIVARQEQARLDDIATALNVAAAGFEGEQAPEGVTQTESEIQDRMIELMASRYESLFPKDLAYAVALQMNEIRRNAEADAKALGLTLPDTALPVDPLRVRDLEDGFLSAGAEPGTARAAAIAQATEEAYADWFMERVEQGGENVGRPVTPAGGEGVRVAGEPGVGAPAGGSGVSQSTGVDATTTNAGLPAGGETTAPGTVETVTPTPDLTGAPSGTQASQTVEAKEKRPAVLTEGAAETTAAKPAAPAKPKKPLNAWQLADKLAGEVGGDVSVEAKREELRQELATRGLKPTGVDAAIKRFDNKLAATQPKPKAQKTTKLSLRNARFAEAPSTERLFRASAADKKYPGKFWSSIKEYAERYLTKGTDKGQRTLEETDRLPTRTLNITALSQAPQAERDVLLSDFTAWMQKNAPNVPVEDTQLYDVLTGEATDFAYPQKEDVKYLKYMGYDSVFFAEEGGEKVDTWFVFDKRERAEAVEPKPKRARGRPATAPEVKAAGLKRRADVNAQANRDARRLQKVAADLTTKDKQRRADALQTLQDIIQTSQSTARVNAARNMLKANTTEAERDAIKAAYPAWKARQEEIAAFEAEERAQKKTAQLTPEEKQQKQKDLEAARDKRKREQEQSRIDALEARASRNWRRQTVEAAERKAEQAKQAERIKKQREDKINAQKNKLVKLGKKLAELRQNKPVNKTELLIKEKQYKLEQLRLKVFEGKPIDWNADWEQGTVVRSLEDAAQEIRALRPKEKAKTGKSAAKLLAEARDFDEKTEEETEQDDNALAKLFDKQVEEEEKATDYALYLLEILPDGGPGRLLVAPVNADSINEAVLRYGYTFSEAVESAEDSAFEVALRELDPPLAEGATVRLITEEDYRNRVKKPAGEGKKRKAAAKKPTIVSPTEDKWAGVKRTTRGTVELVPTSSLTGVKPRNKTNTKSDAYLALKASIAKQGIVDPITLTFDRDTQKVVEIFEGNHRLQIARELGIEQVPVVLHERINASETVELEGYKPSSVLPTAQVKTPTEPKQLTPQEQYASLVENVPGAPAFDALSKEAQEQITDLAKRNQLNLAAINRVVVAQAPKFSRTPNVDKADERFGKFTTAGQAAAHVARTGDSFQRALARRLSKLRILQDVKFVVLGPNDALPSSLKGDEGWVSARGVFVPEDNTIYVKSADSRLHGANNITVLHELLHAALQAKINTGRQGLKAYRDALLRGQPVSGFATEVEGLFIDLSRISRRAEAHFRSLADMPTELMLTVGTENERTGKFDIFSDLDEFLAYGMSDPVFQDFLKTVPMEGATGFSRFVQAILRFLGLDSKDQSALSRLVDATDKLIAVRGKFERAKSPVYAKNVAQKILKTAAQTEAPARRYPPEVEKELKKLQKALGSASSIQRKARQQAAEADKTLNKVLRSHSSSTQAMQGLGQAVNNRGAARQTLNDVLGAQYKGFKGEALRQVIALMPTDPLVDWAGRLGLDNVVLAYDQMNNLRASQVKSLNEAALISERLLKLQQTKPGMYKALAATMHYSTLRGIDPSTEAGRKASPSLARLWNSLNPEAKSLYETVRDFHAQNYDKHFELLEKLVDSYGLDGNIADASTPKGSLIASIRRMQEDGAGIKPYFPLMRFGNFWVRTGKGKDSTFHMFESQADKEAFIDRHVKGTGEPKAKLYADELLKDGNDISSARKDMGGYNDLLKRMFENIDSMETQEVIDDFGNPSPELTKIRKEKLKDSIYQMILHTLPDASYRKQFIHRQGKEGFSEDIGRSFATLSTAMANQLARLEYAQQIQNALSSARSALQGNPDAARLNEFIIEMSNRADQQLNPSPENSIGNQMANFANQAAFVYMMTNVKTAVAQMLSVPTFVAPVLASNHGVFRTAKALGSFAAIWNSVGMRKENADGSTSWVAPTIAQSKRVKLNAEERQAAQYMVDRGLAENTLAYDLGNRKQTPTEVQNSAPRRMLRASVNAMTALFHHTERLIREVAFMASFRLNRQKFPNASFEEVAQLAKKETITALGNYASTNRPRGIGVNAEREVLLDAHKPLGRAILQFKMFPAFVTTYFVRNFYRMLKGQSKEERREAFIQFFGTLMMSFTLAGVMGVPGVSFALGVLNGLRKVMMDDDEDDPLEKRDLELWFRNVWMPQTFGDIKIGGKPLSDIMDRGVITALTGFDMTSSMSLNGLWLPTLKESPTVEAGVKEYLLAMMGPFASLVGTQVPRAIDNFNKGKILQGMEQLMPAIARSPITAYRYSQEGAQTTWGAEIKPAQEFTIGQIIGQGLGFSTEGLVARREDLFKANQLRIKVLNDKRKLMDRLDLETRTDDDVQAALEKILKFNQKNWFDPIQADQLSQSLKNRIERRMKSERGLEIEKKYYPQLYRLFEVSGRKLEAEAAK